MQKAPRLPLRRLPTAPPLLLQPPLQRRHLRQQSSPRSRCWKLCPPNPSPWLRSLSLCLVAAAEQLLLLPSWPLCQSSCLHPRLLLLRLALHLVHQLSQRKAHLCLCLCLAQVPWAWACPWVWECPVCLWALV